ncbi:MAG: sigma-54 dependent transcriptional regulator [Myxococcota bacterium]
MTATPQARLLIIDDHIEMARTMSENLSDAGFSVDVAGGGQEALGMLEARPYDVVISDLRMEGVDGMDVLKAVKSVDPTVPVLIMTAFGSVENAVEAMRAGAFHYVTKPFNLDEVQLLVERAAADRRLREENNQLRRMMEGTAEGQMVGTSQAIRRLQSLVDRVALSHAPVLIRGETGSGKELVARALHSRSPRRDQPFISVNCTAIPEQLLESELYGHVKGAYTGATSSRRGLFVEADGGTLFLDEIGDMAPALQTRLLRVLEDGEVRPVGADSPRKVNVRVLAATHRDLEQLARQGRFREDLFFRLNVVPIHVPPLRERREDIAALAQHFLARARARNPESPVTSLSARLLQRLSEYHWPGNVRELENLVERLVIISTEATVDSADLLTPELGGPPFFLKEALERVVPLRRLEAEYITWAIQQCEGNKRRAAELLEVDVSTIYRRERDRDGSR